MNAFSTLALAIAMAASSTVAFAQDAHGAHGPAHGGHAAPAAAELTEGEVKKIDSEAGKITMKHGPIKNLGMTGMTMVLRVKDAAMLEQVKVGDKVRFAADRVNGAITVVQLEKQQ